MRPPIYEPKGKAKEYDELIKSLRLCTSDKRGSGCAKECTYGKKHPLNWWCMDYLLKEAADAIEELQQTVEHYKGCSDDWHKEACDYKSMLPHWIPVEERLPNGNGEYLVSGKDKVWVCEFMALGCLKGWANNATNPYVKYWRPLPEPPGEET